MRLREKRWLWLALVVFLFPLSLVAGRFCAFAPTDDAYHGLVALHVVEPQVLAAAAILSILSVVYRLSIVRQRLGVLESLASAAPPPLDEAFAAESARLGIEQPHLAYISANVPFCFTSVASGRTSVFISRGFADDLDATERRLVAHHELVHVRDRDAMWNSIWHVVFAALVLPGFEEIERWLRLRREARANVSAATIDLGRYEILLARRARDGRSLCAEARPEIRKRGFVAVAPVAVIALLVALGISHADFMRDLPYLSAHHC